jgi:hypothetical protein
MRRLLILLCFFLTSCGGYQVRRDSNPFAQYQISHIAVPMFINRSSFAQLSGIMTTEVLSMLAEFPDLRLSASEDSNADAVLVGIIHSPQSLKDAQEVTGTTFTSGSVGQSIGGRPGLYLPTNSRLNATLTLVLIKRPTTDDLELIDTPFLPFLSQHPKVIFSESFNLDVSYSQTIEAVDGPDSSGVVNATRNRKAMERSFKSMASRATDQFREVVIRAF